MIKAVPIDYAGVTFRSTLEADWARNLDVLGITWSYEPWAVDLGDGVRYLADFYLPGQNVWLEVKGPHNQRLNKTRRFAAALNPDPWDHRRALVVVGRPAERERLTFHGVQPGSDIRIAECGQCDHYTFYDDNGVWACRICRYRIRHCIQYVPALDSHRGCGPTLPFHRAPRLGRAA